MENYQNLLNHLHNLAIRTMDGKVSDANLEMKLVIEGVEYSVDFNADTYEAIEMMIETEMKNNETL